MKTFSRSDRVESLIQQNLSELLKKKIKDPRLETAVITGVKVSRDIKKAYVYFSTSSKEKAKQDALAGFKSAHGFIKRELAGQLGLRYMPGIEFLFDESFDYGAHIENLIKSIKSENGADHIPFEE